MKEPQGCGKVASMQSPRARALLAAGVAAGLLALCLTLPLVATLVAVAVVLALLPIHTSLVGRIPPVFVCWLALSQAGYVLTWPTGFPPRQAVLWTIAALVALCFAVRRPPAWPRLDPAAAGVAGFVAVMCWAWWPWRGDAVHVLDRMLLGWDHSGHYAMVEQLRWGLSADAVGFPGYPRGFHATVASIMELSIGAPAPMPQEIVAYCYGTLTVLGIALAVLVSAVLSTPGLRTRLAFVVPAVAGLITILLLLNDASQAPYYGFDNFVVGCCLAGYAMLLPYGWNRGNDRSRWFMLGVSAAAVFGLWTVLLPFLVPIPLAVYLGRRGEPRLLRRTLAPVVVAAVPVLLAMLIQQSPTRAAAAPGQAVTLFSVFDTFLLITGAITTSSLGWPIVFALSGIAAPLAYAVLRRRHHRRAGTAGWLWLSPATGLLMSVVMLAYEYSRVGEPRYYGVKVLCATTITAGSLGIAASAYFLSRWNPTFVRRPRLRVLTSAIATAVLLNCAGTPFPLPPIALSPGGAVRADLASDRPDARAPLARGILASCALIQGHPGEYYLLLPSISRADLVRAGVWMITCGQSWSTDQTAVLRQLLPDTREKGGDTIIDLPVTAKRILTIRPYAKVLVPSLSYDLAVADLDFAQRARVIAY